VLERPSAQRRPALVARRIQKNQIHLVFRPGIGQAVLQGVFQPGPGAPSIALIGDGGDSFHGRVDCKLIDDKQRPAGLDSRLAGRTARTDFGHSNRAFNPSNRQASGRARGLRRDFHRLVGALFQGRHLLKGFDRQDAEMRFADLVQQLVQDLAQGDDVGCLGGPRTQLLSGLFPVAFDSLEIEILTAYLFPDLIEAGQGVRLAQGRLGRLLCCQNVRDAADCVEHQAGQERAQDASRQSEAPAPPRLDDPV